MIKFSFSLLIISLSLCNYSLPGQSIHPKKTLVKIGIYLNHIERIDVKAQTFYAEFYLNMKWKGLFLLPVFFFLLISCTHRIIPEKPALAGTAFKLDSLPDSEINIPIQINLKPLYAMAEKTVDTHFTSPNYPDDWV